MASIAGIAAVVLVVALLRVSGVFTGTQVAAAPVQQLRYLGVYEPGSPARTPESNSSRMTSARQPNLVSYYSGWNEAFQKSFAETAASHSAITIVQVDPTDISLAELAAGKYDSYLTSYADEVAAFKHQVVISFGHEMNGYWETWGYRHVPAATFVAAWRHIVTLFRHQNANNVIWLWQVNSSSSRRARFGIGGRAPSTLPGWESADITMYRITHSAMSLPPS